MAEQIFNKSPINDVRSIEVKIEVNHISNGIIELISDGKIIKSAEYSVEEKSGLLSNKVLRFIWMGLFDKKLFSNLTIRITADTCDYKNITVNLKEVI